MLDLVLLFCWAFFFVLGGWGFVLAICDRRRASGLSSVSYDDDLHQVNLALRYLNRSAHNARASSIFSSLSVVFGSLYLLL